MPNLSIITSTPPSHHRFHVLDAMRGIAALMVVNTHTAPLLGTKLFAHNGHLAVDFFFCLSGFVIAFSYERRLLEGMRIPSFLSARLIRLYPMVFIGMTIGILKPLLEQLHRSDFAMLKEKFLYYLCGIFMIPLLGTGHNHLVYPLDIATWSLFFELVANLAFAFLAFRRRVPTSLLLLVAAASFCILCAGAHSSVAIVSMGSDSTRFNFGFARVALPFASGVLLLRLYKRYETWQRSQRLNAALAAVSVLLLSLTLLSSLLWMRTRIFELSAIALIFPALVLIGAFARVPEKLNRLCSMLGELSYPLYLLNLVLNYAFANAGLSLAARWPHLRPLLMSIIVGLDTAIALAVARWMDAPIRRFLVRKYNPSPSLATSRA
jgi:peptidoglycan/LPS O-acetylase OafA/YrhL